MPNLQIYIFFAVFEMFGDDFAHIGAPAATTRKRGIVQARLALPPACPELKPDGMPALT